MPSTAPTNHHAPRGAYGFTLLGLNAAESLLVGTPDHWPKLTVSVRAGHEVLDASVLREDSADVELVDGVVVHATRQPARVEFVTPQPLTMDAIVHPFLAGIASIHCHWRGSEVFHGGAFLAEGKAWVLLADRTGGKSTTVAGLAALGLPVLADDLVVLDGDRVMAGPRSIDLREQPDAGLGTAVELGLVGTRERWRLRLGPIEPEVPLGGWIFLKWGDVTRARRLSATERLQRLAAARHFRERTHDDPMVLLRLAAFPCWEVTRPRDPDALQRTARLIVDTVR